MNNNRRITVAVASDLHAFQPPDPGSRDPGYSEPSFLSTRTPDTSPTENPIFSLTNLIREQNLAADVLLCPGDLGDKADPAGINKAWKAIHSLGDSLQSRHVFGTVGNHDMDSRGRFNAFDPRGYLQTLAPPFPSACPQFNQEFWARNFAIAFPTEFCRILVVNSSAFHGYKEEHSQGRISRYCVEAIADSLASVPAPPVNILLCHHHPHKLTDVPFAEEYDSLAGADLLLALLDSGTHGEWFVVHGHKHYPKLCYAAGSGALPTVLSAGSLCAKLSGNLTTRARNQFYILEFDEQEISQYGLVGEFSAWTFAFGVGWREAGLEESLPPRGGFGCRTNPRQLANDIVQLVRNANQSPFLNWSDVVKAVPLLRYVMPSGLETIATLLPTLGIQVVRSGPHLEQLGPVEATTV